MADPKKPLNPLEREETIGIVDGSDHTGEPVTKGRHGYGEDLIGEGGVPKDKAGETAERDPA